MACPSYESNSSFSAPAEIMMIIMICDRPPAKIIIIICDRPPAKLYVAKKQYTTLGPKL